MGISTGRYQLQANVWGVLNAAGRIRSKVRQILNHRPKLHESVPVKENTNHWYWGNHGNL